MASMPERIVKKIRKDLIQHDICINFNALEVMLERNMFRYQRTWQNLLHLLPSWFLNSQFLIGPGKTNICFHHIRGRSYLLKNILI